MQVCRDKIKEKDIYNMDKKSYAIKLIKKVCMIVLKYKIIAYIIQDENSK